MKKISTFFLILFSLYFTTLDAQVINTEEIIYTEEINFTQIKLSDFLLYLSKEGSVEIIAEDSIRLKDIDIFCCENSSLKKILSIVSKSNNFQIIEENDYIFIAPSNNLQEGKGDIIGKILSDDYHSKLTGVKVTLLDDYSSPCYTDINGNFKFKNIPYGIYFLRAEKKGYSIEGEVIEINKNSNKINIFMEKNYSINKNKLLSKNQEKNEYVIDKIKFSDIETIDENLLDDGLRQGIKFAKNQEKGLLYISGNRKKVERIKKIFEDLDSHNKQVRITAEILDVTENLFEELGFSWLYSENDGKQTSGITTGILNDSNIRGIGSLFSSTFNLIRNFDNDSDFLKMTFNMLQGTQDLKISAMPSIVTTSGKNGIFKITEERIIGEEKVENSDNSKTTYSPIFREAGIILNVTPEIMKNNDIILKINLETSDFKMQNYITNEKNNSNYGGSKVSRNIETTVKLKDGETVFIGGLKKVITQNNESSVPYFSAIPVIGSLFKSDAKKNEVTDLYIRLKIDVVKDKKI